MEKWGTPQPPPPPAERQAYAGSNVPMQCILPPDFIQGSPHVQVQILPALPSRDGLCVSWYNERANSLRPALGSMPV
jgi:hypothetical protein